MKREIICASCLAQRKKMFGLKLTEGDNPQLFDPYPGEHMKLVAGRALFSFVCDACGIFISPGGKCWCSSIWSDRSAIGYHEWESHYIEPRREQS